MMDLRIDECKPTQAVSIYNCRHCVITCKDAVDTIQIDSCEQMNVICGAVTAMIEVVDCKNIELQVEGTTSTIAVADTSGCQLFLSRQAALDAEITTSGVSGLQVFTTPDMANTGAGEEAQNMGATAMWSRWDAQQMRWVTSQAGCDR